MKFVQLLVYILSDTHFKEHKCNCGTWRELVYVYSSWIRNFDNAFFTNKKVSKHVKDTKYFLPL